MWDQIGKIEVALLSRPISEGSCPPISRLREVACCAVIIDFNVGETYNPSLTTLSGAWDRTYGFDLTQYFGVLGSAITGIIGMQGDCKSSHRRRASIGRLRLPRADPIPNPLDGAVHYTDLAIIPMQTLVSPYMESFISSTVKDRLKNLYAPHQYTAQAFSPPWDKRVRNYTYWVDDGLSVGGVEFDESEVGGPSINQESFSPGVILWDAGKAGAGAGWISVSRGRMVTTSKLVAPEAPS